MLFFPKFTLNIDVYIFAGFRAQDELKTKLVSQDVVNWKLPSSCDDKELLKYVGGVDLSFSKQDPSIACATLVVLDLKTLEIVYEDFSILRLTVPYVPGFLAFREVINTKFPFLFIAFLFLWSNVYLCCFRLLFF